MFSPRPSNSRSKPVPLMSRVIPTPSFDYQQLWWDEYDFSTELLHCSSSNSCNSSFTWLSDEDFPENNSVSNLNCSTYSLNFFEAEEEMSSSQSIASSSEYFLFEERPEAKETIRFSEDNIPQSKSKLKLVYQKSQVRKLEFKFEDNFIAKMVRKIKEKAPNFKYKKTSKKDKRKIPPEFKVLCQNSLDIFIDPKPRSTPPDPYPVVNWFAVNKSMHRRLPEPQKFLIEGCSQDPETYQGWSKRDCYNNPPFGWCSGFQTKHGVISVPQQGFHGFVWHEGYWQLDATLPGEAAQENHPGGKLMGRRKTQKKKMRRKPRWYLYNHNCQLVIVSINVLLYSSPSWLRHLGPNVYLIKYKFSLRHDLINTFVLFIKNGPPSYSINVVAAVILKESKLSRRHWKVHPQQSWSEESPASLHLGEHYVVKRIQSTQHQ